MTDNELYNAGLKEAQWQITKAMMALQFDINDKTKKLLKFIHDEIEKKLK